MEFVRSDKGKGGDQVTITIQDEEQQAPTARPQLMSYFWLLYLMSAMFSILLGLIPAIIVYGKRSPLKDDLGWFLLIMTIVAVSLTIIASVILVFASCYMRTSHHTVFKTVGSSSGILAHFSLGCFLIFPHIKLNWIAYWVIGVIIFEIVVGYWFLWKNVVSHQQNTEFNDDDDVSFPWILYVPLLIPLQFAALPFLPILFMKLFVPFVAFEVCIFSVFCYVSSRRKNVGNLKPSQQ